MVNVGFSMYVYDVHKGDFFDWSQKTIRKLIYVIRYQTDRRVDITGILIVSDNR